MTDYQEVNPRITDPNMKPQAQMTMPAAPTTAETSMVKGLFTSVYENKIIVLIIVLVIIIIGVIVYFVVRKNDDDKPRRPHVKEPAAPTPAPPEQPVTPPASTTPAPPPPEAAKPRPNLNSLYQASKAAGNKPQTAPDNIADEPEQNSKSEDEIRHLMEDNSETAPAESHAGQ